MEFEYLDLNIQISSGVGKTGSVFEILNHFFRGGDDKKFQNLEFSIFRFNIFKTNLFKTN